MSFFEKIHNIIRKKSSVFWFTMHGMTHIMDFSLQGVKMNTFAKRCVGRARWNRGTAPVLNCSKSASSGGKSQVQSLTFYRNKPPLSHQNMLWSGAISQSFGVKKWVFLHYCLSTWLQQRSTEGIFMSAVYVLWSWLLTRAGGEMFYINVLSQKGEGC